MTKRIFRCIASLLALLLSFSLVACNSSEERTDKRTTQKTTSTTVPHATTQQESVPADTQRDVLSTTEGATTMTDEEILEPAWVLNTTTPCSFETLPSGVVMRTLTISTHHGGEAVRISHLTDTHIIYYNETDLTDPIMKASYDALNGSKNNGWPLSNVAATIAEATKDTSLVVVTGDVVARYSSGALQKTKEYIFDRCDNVLATLGNHDTERISGNAGDPLTEEERRALIAKDWCNDITYASVVLEEKVMVIAMDNGHGFCNEQYPLLSADLLSARQNGYVVLLFFHVPLNTGRTEDNNIPPVWGNHENWSFGTASGCVGLASQGADGKIYSLIRNNGDIIRGIFCGHVHGDFYVEIPAKTATGEATMIPQYIVSPVYSDKGHFLQIIIE